MPYRGQELFLCGFSVTVLGWETKSYALFYVKHGHLKVMESIKVLYLEKDLEFLEGNTKNHSDQY